jgi:RNA recognition motif-containing protein
LQGIAFCEYEDSTSTDNAIEGLNDIALGDSNLKVSRATVGVQQTAGLDGGVGAISMLASASAAENQEHSRVICLMNMVTSDELINDEEYDGIDSLLYPPNHKQILTVSQKSKKTSKRSVRNTAPSSRPRFHVPPVPAPVSESARFTSNTKTPSQHSAPSRLLLAANSRGERSLLLSSLKRASMSMLGSCFRTFHLC